MVKIDTFPFLVDDLDIALRRIVICSRVVEDRGELTCGILEEDLPSVICGHDKAIG